MSKPFSDAELAAEFHQANYRIHSGHVEDFFSELRKAQAFERFAAAEHAHPENQDHQCDR